MKPLLSIVLTGRNDNYGGDFQSRLQNCVTQLHAQLVRYKIPSEIIFVNYNPLPEPAIENFVAWPEKAAEVQIKLVTVPNEVHRKFVAANDVKDVPVNEYLGKNTGIRRSTGDFILCMNPDILIGDAFFKDLSLSENCYYRADRFDFIVENEVQSAENLLEYARKHVSKVWVKAIDYPIAPQEVSPPLYRKIRRKQRWEIFRYNLVRSFNFLWRQKLHPKAEYKYHCNVSGDFMLMHRDAWMRLAGYDERARLALHTDALMVVKAAVSGLQEKMVPTPIYHQEHARRYDASDENSEYRNAYLSFQEKAQQLIREKKVPRGDNHWGLVTFELPTTEI